MWKQVKISEKTYFVYCNFNTNNQDVTFILYDCKETWSQTITLRYVKQKVKLLNKRFDFSEDNIKEALTSDPIYSVIEEQAHSSDKAEDSCLLKLKYRIKSCLLSYEWELRRQSSREFQHTFVQPILVALLGCHQQVDMLTEIIRKKDMELKQFRIEGAVLNRKTLVTKPFDFNDFNQKYKDSNETVIRFKELAKCATDFNFEEESNAKDQHFNVNKVEQDPKFEEKSNDEQSSYTKLSPRQRKRKAKELKLQRLQQHLKLRKQGLEYESSQSQTPSSGNSQTIEEIEQKDKTQQKDSPKQKAESKSVNISPRKSSRYAAAKLKQEFISSEDVIDSENEGGLRSLKEKKSTSCLENDFSTTSSKKTSTTKSTNTNATNAVEANLKSVKSLNLSYNCKSTLLEKSSESLNVFDFSDNNDDNAPEKKESHKTKSLKIRLKKDCGSSSSPVLKNASVESVVSLRSQSQSENLSQSPTPVVINEISSQLNNIRKELESLEAMRLADLKHRTCKA